MAKAKSKRVYEKAIQLEHDLFKLKVADALVNQAWEENVKDYVKVEHVHFFHTIDSQGTTQNTSTSTNGHFHVMEIVTAATDDEPATYKCSPPMQWVHDRRGNRSLRTVNRDDQHVHEVEYIKSEKLRPAKINAEYLKLQATVKTPDPVPGIMG